MKKISNSKSKTRNPILISACLLGINCRHDGTNAYRKGVLKKYSNQCLIPVCPEQLGGLATPRPQAEITHLSSVSALINSSIIKKKGRLGGVKVIDINGSDVTKEFANGANEVLKIVKLLNIKKAALKENSPSCGVHFIYRNGKIVNEMGITARLLKENGIEIEGAD